MKEIPLNQIFYGPPGTGKTYHTMQAALEILDHNKKLSLKEQKEAFDKYKNEGRIRFVTFHPSFSYEEFIEGLRAFPSPEGGGVTYKVVPGIFKQLCEDARNKQSSELPKDFDTRSVWSMFMDEDECTADNIEDFFNMKQLVVHAESNDESSEKYIFSFKKTNEDEIFLKKHTTKLSVFKYDMKENDFIILSCGFHYYKAIGVIGKYKEEKDENGDVEYIREVKWIIKHEYKRIYYKISSNVFHKTYLFERIYDPHAEILSSSTATAEEKEEYSAVIKGIKNVFASKNNNFVLIIDEINRGNIASIFGELITLIEPSKRAGMKDAMSVSLPLSQKGEEFSVPNNVYLIGTMNTADRSLTGMDIALRRRFSFVRMDPRPELLKCVLLGNSHVTLGDVLESMNKRIRVLLSSDYCIGHAMFMRLLDEDVTNKTEVLLNIFEDTVIPLLEEYFFDDFKKIEIVLHDNKKPNKYRFIQADDDNEIREICEDKEYYKINSKAFKDIRSIVTICRELTEEELNGMTLDVVIKEKQHKTASGGKGSGQQK